MKDAYVSKSAGSEGKGFYHQLPIAIARPQTPTCAEVLGQVQQS